MKNKNQIYLIGIIVLLFGPMIMCMDVPPKFAPVADPALHISLATVNAILIKAAYDTKPDILEVLLQIKADPNVKTERDWTPLHYAAFVGDETIIKLLLQYNANVNARSKIGSTPLDFATIYNNDMAIKILAAAGGISFPPKEKDIDAYTLLDRDSKREVWEKEQKARKSAEKRKSGGK